MTEEISPETPEEPKKGSAYVTLTEAQEKAVEVAHQLHLDAVDLKTSTGRLTGYAGTGKTTVIKYISELLGGGVLLLAPTGKAAVRISELTGLPAMTIHKWLYFPKDEVPETIIGPDGKEVATKRLKLTWIIKPPDLIYIPPSRLIIIDEASMLTSELWKDVKQAAQLFGCNVLLVGDPGQLPPVEKVEGVKFSPLDDIEVDHKAHLTEIIRQALDNPIILASKMIREGDIEGALKLFYHYSRSDIPACAEWLLENNGASIVYTNRTRHAVNAAMRSRKNLGREAVEGEPLLILKNNSDLGVFNGEVIPFGGWRRRNSKPIEITNWNKAKSTTVFGLANLANSRVYLADGILHGELEDWGDKAFQFAIHRAGKEMEIHDPTAFPFVKASFGYALTCHKSQGSEWDNVLIVLEKALANTDQKTWLYTAVTRARKTVAFAHW